jgi:hypothetical protein
MHSAIARPMSSRQVAGTIDPTPPLGIGQIPLIVG